MAEAETIAVGGTESPPEQQNTKSRKGRKPKAAPVKRNRVKREYAVQSRSEADTSGGTWINVNFGPFPDTKSAVDAVISAGYEGQFRVVVVTKTFATQKQTSVVLV